MKKLVLFLSVIAITLSLTACKDKYDSLDGEVTGVIDLMLWSGSGTYYEDLGNLSLDKDDLIAQNDAAAYYVAKEFKKLYPNVQINVLATQGDPNANETSWAQKLAKYEADHGAYPGVFATTDLPGNVENGIVADLTRFETDPLYLSMNQSVMQMMNYYGFQAGLPQYVLPWGIYVNRELAEAQNLDVPDPDWDIDEYTRFISNSEDETYYGSMDTPLRIIETGTNNIVKSLFDYDGGDQYVDFNSDEVKDLVEYLKEWNDDSVWGANPEGMFESYGYWPYTFFQEGKVLTLEGDPWMMGDCATPIEDGEEAWWAACKSTDWDYYPRPSTDYVDNTVGIVLDPMAVYNYCLDDGDIACTEEEELRIKIAYTFASFWIADSRSWDARAVGEFKDVDHGVYSSSLNDSFPVTTGDMFDEQMEIWYTPAKHQRFKDISLMPGFQEVVRIYEEGQFWDISDKAYPYYYNTQDGTRQENMYEWRQYWNPDVNGGFEKDDADFINKLKGKLPEWNEQANLHFKESYESLQTGLKRWYNFKDEDFQ